MYYSLRLFTQFGRRIATYLSFFSIMSALSGIVFSFCLNEQIYLIRRRKSIRSHGRLEVIISNCVYI